MDEYADEVYEDDDEFTHCDEYVAMLTADAQAKAGARFHEQRAAQEKARHDRRLAGSECK